MARIYGGNADFYLNDAWIEGSIDTITMNFAVGTGDVTAFADVAQNVVAGKKNTTIELAGPWDNGDRSPPSERQLSQAL